MTDAANGTAKASANASASASERDDALPQKWALTVEEANAITLLADPTYRNLKITQGYHDLKIALTGSLGSRNVTWCAYATWASKTAGSFIRAEEVPSLIRDYLQRADHLTTAIGEANTALAEAHPEAKVDHSLIKGTIEAVMQDVTKYIADGNLRVFAELAPIFAKWVQTFPAGTPRDPKALDAFLTSTLKPGPVDEGGQDLLIEAFRTYHEAMYEADPALKAQQMFHANALVGYHEQIRLQGPIVSSLNAPLIDVFIRNAKELARGKLPHMFHGAVEAVIERVVRPIGERVEIEWREVSTRWLMTLALPKIVLSLGKNVPWLSETDMFPPHLVRATYAPLLKILAQLDRSPDTVERSAAADWGKIEDRMNYIVDLFRSRQQDAQLYEQPFSDEQVAVIREGGVPEGRL